MNDHSKPPGLWAIMAPIKGRIWLGMSAGALSSLCSLLAVAFLALVVRGLIEQTPLVIAHYILDVRKLVMAALALVAASILLRSIAFAVSHMAAYSLELQLRTRLTEHLARLPLGDVIVHGSGALKKILLDDVKGLHVFVADSTPFMGRSYASPLITVILLFLIDWRLAFVAIGVFALGMVAMWFAMRDFEQLRKGYDDGNERINAAVVEFVQAMPVVRTFDTGSGTFNRYHDALIHFRNMLSEWIVSTGRPARITMIVMSPLVTLLAISALGIFLYTNELISLPVLMAFWLLSTGLAEALMPLMWLMNMNRMAEIGAIRINEFLAKPQLPISEQPEIPRDASLSFDKVTFSYPGRKQPALSQVSFKASPGSVTALVGPSGGGKSTVARLIPRFYDVHEGEVSIGGVDVRRCDPDMLMHHVSFVFQETFLFHDTIIENIRIARPQASDDEVIEAARSAMAHNFIMELPERYDTIAGDRGARLSGGQRQRITIARALLRDAPILVLDEATSFADPENELQIIEALSHLMRGRTTLIIAHRLSTIQNADNILVFDQGRIAEHGRHKDLLDMNGLYARLWHSHQKAQDWMLQHEKNREIASDATSA